MKKSSSVIGKDEEDDEEEEEEEEEEIEIEEEDVEVEEIEEEGVEEEEDALLSRLIGSEEKNACGHYYLPLDIDTESSSFFTEFSFLNMFTGTLSSNTTNSSRCEICGGGDVDCERCMFGVGSLDEIACVASDVAFRRAYDEECAEAEMRGARMARRSRQAHCSREARARVGPRGRH